MNRAERRAAERAASKADRQAGTSQTPTTNDAMTTSPIAPVITPAPVPAPVQTDALRQRLQACQQKASFRVLPTENAAGFEALKQKLFSEHQPATTTETILVTNMAESHWLAQRAQRLQDTCIDLATGAINDDKKFNLYLRYQTIQTRAFHKCLQDLLKLRSERRKADFGFEAQKFQREKHEILKRAQQWALLKKDFEVHAQLSDHILQNFKAKHEFPGFEAQFAVELAKRDMPARADRLPISAAA
jgi:hypothetical protein